MTHSPVTIGILDSGFGGLSVLDQTLRRRPHWRYLYYGDFEHAPYGTKSLAEVGGYVEAAVRELLGHDIQALALACNTATSAAVAELRVRLALPVIGMEPALKPAVQAFPTGVIAVMATQLTLREGKFRDLMGRVAGQATILEIPCPGLADAVDRGDPAEAADCVHHLLARSDPDRRADAVVLGCSHYTFVQSAIRHYYRNAAPLFDGSEGTARRLIDQVESSRPTTVGAPVEPTAPTADPQETIELVGPGATPQRKEKALRLLNQLAEGARRHG